MIEAAFQSSSRLVRHLGGAPLVLAGTAAVSPAWAQNERMYFPAVENVTNVLVQRINAETVRIDMAEHPDNGFASTSAALASPMHYFEATSSDALVNGQPAYRMNTTSGLLVNLPTDGTAASLDGWGWQNTSCWLTQATTVTFANGGAHTIRIKVREDRVRLDHIVLSPAAYPNAAPGPPSSDWTIVPRP